jgi:hypothetical protein
MLRGQFRLGQEPACASYRPKKSGRCGLRIVHRRGRTSSAAAPIAATSHRAGAGAADHQVSIRKGLRGVVNEWRSAQPVRWRGVIGPQCIDLFMPLCVSRWVSLTRNVSAKACGTTSFAKMGAQTTAHHQHTRRPLFSQNASDRHGQKSYAVAPPSALEQPETLQM